MTLLPVVVRELIVTARRKDTYVMRLLPPVLASLVVLWMLLLGAAHASFAQQGQTLFQILAWLSFIYCLLAGATVTADSLSQEKREGTIGLLFLTPLGGFDVVAGKFAAKSLASGYAQLSIVPVLSIAMLLGGVEWIDVARMGALLGNTMFVSLSAGVFVSCLSRDARRAMFATGAIMLALAFVPYVLGEWLTKGLNSTVFQGLEVGFVLPSPFFAFQMVQDSWARKFMKDEFYLSLAFTHLCGWFFLVTAGVLLPRLSRDRPPNRWTQKWVGIQEAWAYGNRAVRDRRRARLLDANPVSWLTGRHYRRLWYPWIFLGGMGLVWLWIYFGFTDLALDLPTSLVLTFCVQGVMKVWYGCEVCLRLAEDRRSGALELLLSTPVGGREIARGQAAALRALFLKPLIAFSIVQAILFQAGLSRFSHGFTEAQITGVFLGLQFFLWLDLLTLKWAGMWEAMLTASSGRAIARVLGRVLILPWLGVGAMIFTFGVAATFFGTGVQGFSVLLVFWTSLGLINDLWRLLRSRARFLAHFRTVASEGGYDRSHADAPTTVAAPASGPAPFRRRVPVFLRRHPVLATLGCLLLAAIISVALYRLVKQRELDRLVANQRARGQPATLEELARWQPKAPAGEDASADLQIALQTLPMLNNALLSQRDSDSDDELSDLRRAEIRVLLRTFQESLNALHAALRKPACASFVRWEDPLAQDSMQFWRFAPLAQALYLEGRLRLEDNQAEAVVETIRELLRLSQFAGAQPVFQAQYPRSAMIVRATELIGRLLGRQALPEPVLKELASALEAIERSDAIGRAAVGERALMILHRERTMELARRWMGRPSLMEQAGLTAFVAAGKWTGLYQRDFINLMEETERSAVLTTTPYPQRLELTQRALGQRGPGTIFLFMWHGYFPACLANLAQIEAQYRLAIHFALTALAIERYRARDGHLPAGLGELLPGFLPSVPLDPLTGKPLYYELTRPGYRLAREEEVRPLKSHRGKKVPLTRFEVKR